MIPRTKHPEPTHVPGTTKGEELALKKREPGRGGLKYYQTSRDATGINAEERTPILPSMPNLPPA